MRDDQPIQFHTFQVIDDTIVPSTKTHIVADVIQYFIDYGQALREGDWLASAVVTSSSATATVSATIVLQGRTVRFLLTGGVLNETFTITVQATNNNAEIMHHVITFTVVAP
jgi:hypothetical protein